MQGHGRTDLRELAVIVAVLAAVRVAVADDTAALAYQQAEALAKQGKWAEACPLYDASYRADPEIGVLLHLADCHEHVGKLASAWAEFDDAAELAHRKGDNREALARTRADALKPKLAYVHLVAPASPPAGLVVRRDGVDVTVLVGTDMPVDPGEHDVTANAPGHIEWKKHVVIGTLPTTTQIPIPPLEVAPTAPAKQVVHEGSLEVTSQADAHITLDGTEIGVGHVTRKVTSGGHQLRVTAPGMRAFQTEIVVADGEARTVEVPLEREVVVVPPPPAGPRGPSVILSASAAPGVKLVQDRTAEFAYRAELGFRLGSRVDFGLFAEYGSIDTSNACGFDMPGPMPSTPYDFGPHVQFTRCAYVMPGLLLVIHVLPERPVDPYIAITPAFRFGFTDYTEYVAGVAQQPHSELFPALVTGVRAGVEFHPHALPAMYGIGPFVESSITVSGQETCNTGDICSSESGKTFLSLFGGLRGSLAF